MRLSYLTILATVSLLPLAASAGQLDERLVTDLTARRERARTAADRERIDATIRDIRARPCDLNNASACQAVLDDPSFVNGVMNGSASQTMMNNCARHTFTNEMNPTPACGCLGNAFAFGQRKSRLSQRGYTMGFELSDARILEGQDALGARMAGGGRRMMDLPEFIERLLHDGNGNLPENFRSAIPRGAEVLEYDSQTVGNPSESGPRSFRRALFSIPGDKYDQWVQLTLPKRGSRNEKQNLIDFITIQKVDENGRRLEKPRIHFRQYWRSYDGSGRLNIVRRDQASSGHNSFDKCISCHPSGMRPLDPLPGSVGSEQYATMERYNKRMKDYGQIDWGETLLVPGQNEHASLGPALGERSGCTRCHNGQPPNGNNPDNRGALTLETTESHIQHKLIENPMMPPRAAMEDFWNKLNSIDSGLPLDEALHQRMEDVSESDGSNTYSTVIDVLEERRRLPASEVEDLRGQLADYQEEGRSLLQLLNRDRPNELRKWLTAARCVDTAAETSRGRSH